MSIDMKEDASGFPYALCVAWLAGVSLAMKSLTPRLGARVKFGRFEIGDDGRRHVMVLSLDGESNNYAWECGVWGSGHTSLMVLEFSSGLFLYKRFDLVLTKDFESELAPFLSVLFDCLSKPNN